MNNVMKKMIDSRWMLVISLSFIICHLSFVPARAQTDRQYVRQGNKFFQKGDYEHAEVSYSKAIEKNDRNPQAHYNLGNALMAQQKDSAAIEQFQKSRQLETNPLRKAQSYHNIGVMCQQHKMYGEAIESYKQALRLNPNDDATRYNLVLCKHLKKKQDEQQQNQDQQKQDQKQDEQKQDQQKKDEQKKQDQQKQDQKQQEQKPQMSKENAEQLLNAAMQQEKQTQERMKEAQRQNQRRQNEKNW